ncbi:TIGR01459 family HAD-type hydrolase [Falsirhodobacter xinxiangensis]|uniref:TIGR01459 family HAD-type hydrolase n=1 Tax=Falsirhodobacter xinxiangensis TaxID=2530049 RepID=UPI0010AAD7E7|nr:TIGR01459 family HAD-type hydrolase [Rhodobacter xinxiangensis]
MTRIVSSLAEISHSYRAVFCDLWGCLHDGVRAHPAAVAALQAFRAKGGVVVLVTNAPRPKPSIVAQLARLQVPDDAWDDVVSSGDAAQYALITGAVGQNVYFIGADKDEPFFSDLSADLAALKHEPINRVPLEQAEGIVCTGPFNDLVETPEDYAETLAFAKSRGMKLLCANPDIEVDLGDKRIYCAGAIAQAYDRIGGTSLYFGKPHAPIYDLARRRLHLIDKTVTDAEILCIGDGILTDIQGGVSEGLDSLFITSGLAAKHFGDDTSNPDATLLEKWLIEQTLTPTFSVGFLR